MHPTKCISTAKRRAALACWKGAPYLRDWDFKVTNRCQRLYGMQRFWRWRENFKKHERIPSLLETSLNRRGKCWRNRWPWEGRPTRVV